VVLNSSVIRWASIMICFPRIL